MKRAVVDAATWLLNGRVLASGILAGKKKAAAAAVFFRSRAGWCYWR